MKKQILLFLTLLSMSFSNAQIYVYKDAAEVNKTTKTTLFQDFKKTTTVFILTNLYKKEEYESILKDSWTVTPFEVVMPQDFDLKKYINGNYSFATLDCWINKQSMVSFLHCSFDFHILNIDKITKKYNPKKDGDDELSKIVANNKIGIAHIGLAPTSELIGKGGNGGGYAWGVSFREDYKYDRSSKNLKERDEKTLAELIYEEQVFTNYNLGMLKNYFQKINEQINKEEPYSSKDGYSTAKLKDLKNEVLYLPERLKIKYNARKMTDEDWKNGEFEKMLKLYKYKYEFIKDEELDRKILAKEPFYYLLHTKLNTHKFISVVNGQTGEIVYFFHDYGASHYNLKEDDFKNLMKSI